MPATEAQPNPAQQPGSSSAVPHPQAFAARCLLRAARSATLATQHHGQPQASLVTHAILPDGTPVMLLSAIAQHTSHLQADPRCALFVAGTPENQNPQTAPRFALMGHAEPDPDPAHHRFWLQRHPYAALYADFTDFTLWRLIPDSAQFVAGFGRAFTMQADALLPPAAGVQAIAAASAALLAPHAQDAAAIERAAQRAGQHGCWNILGMDCDGVDLIQDETILRAAFDAPAYFVMDAEAALQRLFTGCP